MLNFPEIKDHPEPPLPKMTLEEYVEFCSFCLENNPNITPENCMTQRADEKDIKEPFRFPPDLLP